MGQRGFSKLNRFKPYAKTRRGVPESKKPRQKCLVRAPRPNPQPVQSSMVDKFKNWSHNVGQMISVFVHQNPQPKKPRAKGRTYSRPRKTDDGKEDYHREIPSEPKRLQTPVDLKKAELLQQFKNQLETSSAEDLSDFTFSLEPSKFDGDPYAPPPPPTRMLRSQTPANFSVPVRRVIGRDFAMANKVSHLNHTLERLDVLEAPEKSIAKRMSSGELPELSRFFNLDKKRKLPLDDASIKTSKRQKPESSSSFQSKVPARLEGRYIAFPANAHLKSQPRKQVRDRTVFSPNPRWSKGEIPTKSLKSQVPRRITRVQSNSTMNMNSTVGSAGNTSMSDVGSAPTSFDDSDMKMDDSLNDTFMRPKPKKKDTRDGLRDEKSNDSSAKSSSTKPQFSFSGVGKKANDDTSNSGVGVNNFSGQLNDRPHGSPFGGAKSGAEESTVKFAAPVAKQDKTVVGNNKENKSNVDLGLSSSRKPLSGSSSMSFGFSSSSSSSSSKSTIGSMSSSLKDGTEPPFGKTFQIGSKSITPSFGSPTSALKIPGANLSPTSGSPPLSAKPMFGDTKPTKSAESKSEEVAKEPEPSKPFGGFGGSVGTVNEESPSFASFGEKSTKKSLGGLEPGATKPTIPEPTLTPSEPEPGASNEFTGFGGPGASKPETASSDSGTSSLFGGFSNNKTKTWSNGSNFGMKSTETSKASADGPKRKKRSRMEDSAEGKPQKLFSFADKASEDKRKSLFSQMSEESPMIEKSATAKSKEGVEPTTKPTPKHALKPTAKPTGKLTATASFISTAKYRKMKADEKKKKESEKKEGDCPVCQIAYDDADHSDCQSGGQETEKPSETGESFKFSTTAAFDTTSPSFDLGKASTSFSAGKFGSFPSSSAGGTFSFSAASGAPFGTTPAVSLSKSTSIGGFDKSSSTPGYQFSPAKEPNSAKATTNGISKKGSKPPVFNLGSSPQPGGFGSSSSDSSSGGFNFSNINSSSMEDAKPSTSGFEFVGTTPAPANKSTVPTGSVYGNPNPSGTSFGGPATPSTQSTFGGPATHSAFGGSNGASNGASSSAASTGFSFTSTPTAPGTSSTFGGTSTPSSAFGGNSTPASTFGGTSAPSSAFGGASAPSSTGFGASTPATSGTFGAFGGASFGQPQAASTPFGNSFGSTGSANGSGSANSGGFMNTGGAGFAANGNNGQTGAQFGGPPPPPPNFGGSNGFNPGGFGGNMGHAPTQQPPTFVPPPAPDSAGFQVGFRKSSNPRKIVRGRRYRGRNGR